MAADLFSRDVNFGGAFSADGARITFGDQFGCGMMVQSLQYQYQQNITRLYEVGCPDIYLVAGRTQGQLSVNRIIGPRRLTAAFYTTFGDVCQAGSNAITFSGNMGCSGGAADAGARQAVSMQHVVISSVGGSVRAADMIINEAISMMFLYLVVAP